MDANGSRYHTLIGASDWQRSAPPAAAVEWRDGALRLQALLFEFRPGRAEALPEEYGRGGVFDAYGNLYWLSSDRRTIMVRSVGSGDSSRFWPVAGGTPAHDRAGAIAGYRAGSQTPSDSRFQPLSAAADTPPLPELDALTITAAHYLVVASTEAGGLLIFDLYGGGPPLFQGWPELPVALALVALADGGVGVLSDNHLLRSGPDLKPRFRDDRQAPWFTPEGTRQDAQQSSPPAAEASPPAADNTSNPLAGEPCDLNLEPALPADDTGDRTTATAIAALPGNRLLILSQSANRPGATWLSVIGLDGTPSPLVAGQPVVDADRPPPIDPDALPAKAIRLDLLLARITTGAHAPGLAGRTLAIDWGQAAAGAVASAGTFSLIVVDAAGDQAYRFAAGWQAQTLVVGVVGEYLPLRRYHGMGLAALAAGMTLHGYPDARVFYAGEKQWSPLLALPQPRYARQATLLVPAPELAWDSGQPACVWHRLLLDQRLPPGTSVSVDSRCVENLDDLAAAEWRSEPALLRASRGSELPWRDTGPSPAGTWELLLQAARGRHLQLRLTITGDGRQTPSLHALRVWYPRFSYASQYLPPMFRADAGSADFLDRLLALFEGEFTRWEDRIAAAQWLFDARTAPAATLDWLASWLGVAFDPACDERRRRLLIRHALLGHARRGTIPGLLLGATLAWETEVDEDWLRAPEKLTERAHGVRLQELFGWQTALAGNAWRPALGRAWLLHADRLAGNPSLADPAELAALGITGAAARAAANPERRQQLQRAFGFIPRAAIEEERLWSAWLDAQNDQRSPPGDQPLAPVDAADWRAYLDSSRPCAPLRQRWQDFLARRWQRVSELNAAWGTRWRSFSRIPSPIVLPASEAALADWHRFEAQVLRALGHAHRFRIVLPLPAGTLDLDELTRRRASVLRVIEREKPAHTTAEVRFGFDLFRVGDARLGLDSRLENGLARYPELAALAGGTAGSLVLGRSDLGGGRLATTRPQPPADRVGLDRGGLSLRRPT